MEFLLQPPLNNVTKLYNQKEVIFSAVVFDVHVVVVELWWAVNGKDWQATELTPAPVHTGILEVHKVDDVPQRKQYKELSCTIPLKNVGTMEFSLRCKIPTENDYIFLGDGSKGEILSNTLPTSKDLSFRELFAHTDCSFHINQLSTKADGSKIFRLRKAAFSSSSLTKTDIGFPLHLEQYLAYVRIWEPWLEPRIGIDRFCVDKDCVALVYERFDGLSVVLLPVSGTPDSCNSFLRSTSDGHIEICTRNDSGLEQDGQVVVIGVGAHLHQLMEDVFSVVRHMIHPSTATISKTDRKPWTPEWYDGLMYCTWNGLGNRMSQETILQALDDLDKIGIRVHGLIIDDGWQRTNENRQIYDFEANNSFPDGLRGLVSVIRQRFRYIKEIGVWSTIFGCWDGIEPGSLLDGKYKTIDCFVPEKTIRVVDKDWYVKARTIRVVNDEDVFRYYNDYFSFLAESGITCVKIDDQSTIDEISDPVIRGKLWQNYQDAIWQSSLKYFGRKIIYCMAMVPTIMLYSLQSSQEKSPVLRTSIDFFPDNNESHFRHVYINFFNSIFTQHLHILPDFDMFQSEMIESTDDALRQTYAPLHAAARCLCGGPVYFTDTPGSHNMDLLTSCMARSPSGTHMALRPNNIALPKNVFHSLNTRSILRVVNQCGLNGDVAVLGLFNLTQSHLIEFVGHDDFTFSNAPKKYLVRSYRSSQIWRQNEMKLLSLGPGEWDVLTAAPVFENGNTSITSFGLINNILGSAGLHSIEVETSDCDGRICILLQLKCVGLIGIQISDLESRERNLFVTAEGITMEKSNLKFSKQMLQVDLEKQLPFVHGKNLIEVKVYLDKVIPSILA